MNLTSKRKKELDELVQNFCVEQNLNMKEDLFKELSKLNFVVHSVKFKRPLAGMILVDENSDEIERFGSNKLIFYNADLNLYEIRFTVLHELAHYISKKEMAKGEKVLVAARDHNERYHDDVDEQEKDYMAAAMLLPRKDFENYIESYLQDKLNSQLTFEDFKNQNKVMDLTNDEYFIQKTQRDYRVDKTLVVRRIEELTEPTEA